MAACASRREEVATVTSWQTGDADAPVVLSMGSCSIAWSNMMKRRKFISLLMLGVVIASVIDGCRETVGLEFWRVYAVPLEDVDRFCRIFVADLLLYSVLGIACPAFVGLMLGTFLSGHEKGNDDGNL
jgi:hypothetical protein